MNYPNRCDLSQTVVDSLQTPEGFKAGFLMYQFRDQDKFLIDTIKKKFKSWNCTIREAASEPGTGVKFCKVCRLATASDFGIGVLTPENPNVSLELGLLWGQGKDILLIANPKRLPKGKSLNDLHFDVNSFMVNEYKTKKELEDKLDNEAPPFLDRVRVFGQYHQALVKSIREKLRKLKEQDTNNLEFLKFILLTGRDEFGSKFLETNLRVARNSQDILFKEWKKYIENLGSFGFVEIEHIDSVERTRKGEYLYNLTIELLPILRQEAFKEID
jgi:hypothetical protein